MKIGLASYEFRNKDVPFNVSQIEKAMKAARGTVDLLCFGEAFLQGFDALKWNYVNDREVAVVRDSEVMELLCGMTVRYQTDLLFGYLEREGEAIYSSCALIEKGALTQNYRRISRGWKEYSITDGHYREGTEAARFSYRGQRVVLALCGDMWDAPEKFSTDGLLIWPVYVNFTLEEWASYEGEYAGQAALAAGRALMVNSLSEDPKSWGGAFYFAGGKVKEKTAYGKEEILVVEV